MIDSFHFLRPWWLLALIPAVGVWVMLRRAQDPARAYRGFVAPHLLTHLVVGPKEKHAFRPSTLLLPLWVLISISMAGPTWQREPSPFAEEQAGLMVCMKVRPTMKAEDLRPSRLERARHKLHDLLDLRTGGSAGLIAYSGSAHLVMPLTRDSGIVDQMAQSLDPEIMPVEGDVLADALALAKAQFEKSGKAGSVLVITDSVAPAQNEALAAYCQEGGPPVQFLAVVGSPLAGEQSGIDAGARALSAPLQLVTVDDTDVRRVLARSESLVTDAAAAQEEARWRDSGYALVPLVALGALMWGRKGFSVRWE